MHYVTTGQALLKFITPNFDLRGFVVPEVSWVSGELSGSTLTQDRLSLMQVSLTGRHRKGGAHFGLPLSFLGTSRPPHSCSELRPFRKFGIIPD